MCRPEEVDNDLQPSLFDVDLTTGLSSLRPAPPRSSANGSPAWPDTWTLLKPVNVISVET